MDKISAEQRSCTMAKVRNRHTAPELLIRSMLHRRGYRFRLHKKDLPGTPDIVLPARKKVIFVHGCFWHGHDCRRGNLPDTNRPFWEEKIARNRARDSNSVERLNTAGWDVFTIWQCDLNQADDLEERLVRFLGPKQAQ